MSRPEQIQGMQACGNHPFFARFFGGWELLLIAAFTLFLLGGWRFVDGLRRGLREFRKASDQVTSELANGARDAGHSLGGIFGKPAAEALTHDNRVAEFYDMPPKFRWRSLREISRRVLQRIRRWFTAGS